jgi:predicted RNA-binding Zn-ribbon protein involved in translation (DUF1610 family)
MHSKSIFMQNPLFQNCPKCGESGVLRKSHPRNWKETLINDVTFFKVYRCRKCGWRNFLSTYNSSAITLKAILFYAGLVIAVAYIVLFALSKLVK